MNLGEENKVSLNGEENEKRLSMLKKRKKRCVCKHCGGNLELKQIIFHEIKEARIELFCPKCEKMEYGVEPEIYLSACNFIDNWTFDYYPNLDQNIKKRQMNIAKISEILSWGCQNIGILNEQGFSVPVLIQQGEWEELMEVSSEKIIL